MTVSIGKGGLIMGNRRKRGRFQMMKRATYRADSYQIIWTGSKGAITYLIDMLLSQDRLWQREWSFIVETVDWAFWLRDVQ